MRPRSGGKRTTRPCLICASTTLHSHFGVDACRACANFFKKTLELSAKYICRQGDGKCVIRKHDRYGICKGCRWERCLSLGMHVKLQEEEELASSSAGSPPAILSPPAPSDTLLGRIAREFRKFCRRRERNENALQSTDNFRGRSILAERGKEKVFIASTEYDRDAQPVEAVDLIHYMRGAFPEYAVMNAMEQRAIFKNCAGTTCILRGFYYTEKYFEESSRYFATAPNAGVDVLGIDAYLPIEMPTMQKAELARAKRRYFEKQRRYMYMLLRRAELTETEHMALFALCVWSFETANFPEELSDLGERVKKDIIAEISRHYREDVGQTECSTRIGTLMTLVHALQEGSEVYQEEIQVYTLLDLFKEGCYVHKTMLK